jgi:hypothetical protein
MGNSDSAVLQAIGQRTDTQDEDGFALAIERILAKSSPTWRIV